MSEILTYKSDHASKAMGHTPPPWTLAPDDIKRVVAGDRMVMGRAFDGSFKSIVDRVRGGTPEQADANARLIVEAPTMYVELEMAADTFRDFSAVLRAIGKDVMSAAADVAERHIREYLRSFSAAGYR